MCFCIDLLAFYYGITNFRGQPDFGGYVDVTVRERELAASRGSLVKTSFAVRRVRRSMRSIEGLSFQASRIISPANFAVVKNWGRELIAGVIRMMN